MWKKHNKYKELIKNYLVVIESITREQKQRFELLVNNTSTTTYCFAAFKFSAL